jgi:phosphate butyryltransferase
MNIKNMEELLAAAKSKGPKRVALVAAEDEASLQAVMKAHSKGLALPILIGDKALIRTKAEQAGLALDGAEIVQADDNAQAAALGVKMVHEGKADIVMKGLLHTDVLLKAVLDKENGLRTGKLLSHVSVFEIPAYHKLLFITDVAMNIAPGLEEKKVILQNAVDLYHSFGLNDPKVAVLAAVEEVNEKMTATLDAACLAKMADRKQIKGAIVDGPLAMDNAISLQAALDKGIKSPVAGDADILLCPNIESCNILFKTLLFFTESKLAALVMGAKAPIVLTTRADSFQNKYYSLALGVMAAC